jgi:hypothetical protein
LSRERHGERSVRQHACRAGSGKTERGRADRDVEDGERRRVKKERDSRRWGESQGRESAGVGERGREIVTETRPRERQGRQIAERDQRGPGRAGVRANRQTDRQPCRQVSMRQTEEVRQTLNSNLI